MKRRKPEGYLGDRSLQPETLMMGYGYHPEWSEGALKPPIFQTSTYEQEAPGQHRGFDYSRTNNPTRARLEAVLAEAPEQERMEAWIMREVERGVPLPGLYPMNEETKARYAADKGKV